MSDDSEDNKQACEECDAVFMVVWNNDGMWPANQYCPRCGEKLPEREPGA